MNGIVEPYSRFWQNNLQWKKKQPVGSTTGAGAILAVCCSVSINGGSLQLEKTRLTPRASRASRASRAFGRHLSKSKGLLQHHLHWCHWIQRSSKMLRGKRATTSQRWRKFARGSWRSEAAQSKQRGKWNYSEIKTSLLRLCFIVHTSAPSIRLLYSTKPPAVFRLLSNDGKVNKALSMLQSPGKLLCADHPWSYYRPGRYIDFVL